ncbi:hypothetical protein Y032_0432g1355 [Ancylostoma ceylanicum]|uniref:Endonuclease/exonuclease/phosphatase domain-containing protein n=1 Tax=Ancylostoma ceylanicum TaxID=53326 RepID=A0A016X0D7_9BILA|nr:hypothetical protein Y032_0432g1355 [Ancylostoma ceylanicum]
MGAHSFRSQPPYDGRGSRPTWELYHNEIDHIIVNRRFYLTDVGVVPKFYTGSDHHLLRARFFFLRKGEKAAKYKKRSPKPTINWDLFTTLAGFWEDTVIDNIDEECERPIQHLRDSTKRKPRVLEPPRDDCPMRPSC